jgi:hypothetical protein
LSGEAAAAAAARSEMRVVKIIVVDERKKVLGGRARTRCRDEKSREVVG